MAEVLTEQQKPHPHKRVEVWSQDQARLGLKAVVRRVWALRGQRPLALHRTRYEWLYVFVFICPKTGQSYFLILPGVNTQLMSLALREFARDLNSRRDKVIVLLLDNAGWHTSKDLRVPPGLVLLRTPAYTPQLAPAETIVPLVREVAANRDFADLGELETTLDQRCVYLMRHPELIRAKANFHWLPQ